MDGIVTDDSDASPINVGDWVRFYRNGELVIWVVEYVTRNVVGHVILSTTAGAVNADSVLEVRTR